jgi:hypothetical protein
VKLYLPEIITFQGIRPSFPCTMHITYLCKL